MGGKRIDLGHPSSNREADEEPWEYTVESYPPGAGLHIGPCPDMTDALDALESMVCQYLRYDNDPENFYNHAFMSAGEYACATLCRLRPDRWRETPCGMEFIGDDNSSS